MSVTRRHHYVWKHYLGAWETNGTIAVSRSDGRTFRTDPVNVAVEKDFYRIPELSPEDITFVKLFITSMVPRKALRDIAFEWLDMYAAPSELRRIVMIHRAQPDGDIIDQIEKLEIQAEESVHSYLEGDAVPLLDALRSGAKDPWSDDDDAVAFATFLSFQHMRTKKMKESVLARSSTPERRELMSRIFPVLRAISASNMGWSLYSDRKNWRLRRLTADRGLNFITSDQPTWNMLEPTGHNDLAIYYPVSPTVAVLFENINNPSTVQFDDNLPDAEIARLNKLVVDKSHEQIFGLSNAYLEELRGLKSEIGSSSGGKGGRI